MADPAPTTGPFRALLLHFSPAWLVRHYGERLTQGMVGLVGDAIAEAATAALVAPLLADENSPADAVTKVAADRRIDRYPTDTTETHRARTLDAWNVWSNPGTEVTIEGQLVLFGYPDSHVVGLYDNPALPRRFFTVSSLEGISGLIDPAQVALEMFKIVNKFRSAEERVDDVLVMTTGRPVGIHPLTGLVHTIGDWGPGITTVGASSGTSYRDTV